MNKYNLRPRKMINYDENAYFDRMGIKEPIEKVEIKTSFTKNELIINIRNALHMVEISPQVHKPYFAMKAFELTMIFIRMYEDYPRLREVLQNKMNEIKNEKQMSKYKAILNKYCNELESY